MQIILYLCNMNRTQQPLVTFIITYYNLPVQMLCECIDSILALSLKDTEREIIVIDDGSDVSPMNGLIQYANDIIYIRQNNQGVSVARNIAFQIAHGTYIQILDGDDFLLKAPYEYCLDIIRKDNDLDVLLFNFTHSVQNDDSNYNYTEKTSGITYMNHHNIRASVCCILFRQSVRSQLIFTPGIQYGEDEEFTPQLLLRAETVIATNAKAYYYRKRASSVVHQHNEHSHSKRLDDTLQVILHLNQIADRLPNNDQLSLQRRVAQLTMDYLYNIIVLTHSRTLLNERIKTLYDKGLFPLPNRDYSQKYVWFRRMINTRLGRAILLNTLPLLKRER